MTSQPLHRPAGSPNRTAPAAPTSCDLEPIHLCGAIQPYGLLLAVDPDALTVVAASANVAEHLGLDEDTPALGANIADLLGPQVVDSLIQDALSSNPHEGLPVRVALRTGPDQTHQAQYDMVAHLSGELVVLEFEPAGSAETAMSATFYQRQRGALQRLGRADDVERLCQVAADEVRALTGYDAVRVYRLEPDAHGYVIAESCAPGVDRYLGLHFPAGDIPRQARALYLRNWIRVIGSVDYEPVPIRTLPGGPRADQLDLTMSVLRSVSPVHLQYLRNMGLSASMSISLVVDNQLWGLITCHHRAPRRLNHVERLACETLGQLMSVRLRAAESMAAFEEAASLGRHTAQVITAMVAGETPVLGAITAGESLLGMVEADGVVIELDGQRASVGVAPDPDEVDLLLAEVTRSAGGGASVIALDSLSWLRSSQSPPADPRFAGALCLPFSGRTQGFVLWLRTEQPQTVRWAGEVMDTNQTDGAASPAGPNGLGSPAEARPPRHLTPRASFAEWREQRTGHSAPWRPAQIAAATELVHAIPDVLLHRAQSRLVRFAMHDPLTGLPNRRMLENRLTPLLAALDLELALADDPQSPHPGETGQVRDPAAGLLFVDLDGPPGHAGDVVAGDELLTLVAERLREIAHRRGTVARMGGDEFVMLLPGADLEDSLAFGERVVDELHRLFADQAGAGPSLGVTVGVTSLAAGTDVTEALRQADAALYHARNLGRNQVAFYDAVSGAAASREQQAGEELRRALANGQVNLSYQPIVRLTGGREAATTVGYRALLEWQHPRRGLLTADRFVPIAEQAGLLHELSQLVIPRAIEHLSSLADDSLLVVVNVAVPELVRADFVAQTLAWLTAAGVDPHRLCIEVSELQLADQPHLATVSLRELEAAGLRVAIGDVGTGLAALPALRTLDQVLVKISPALIANVPHRRQDVAVVAAMVQLAHALGWQTVAEGIRTPQQFAAIRDLGFDFAQGDLLPRGDVPSPRQEVAGNQPSVSG